MTKTFSKPDLNCFSFLIYEIRTCGKKGFAKTTFSKVIMNAFVPIENRHVVPYFSLLWPELILQQQTLPKIKSPTNMFAFHLFTDLKNKEI